MPEPCVIGAWPDPASMEGIRGSEKCQSSGFWKQEGSKHTGFKEQTGNTSMDSGFEFWLSHFLVERSWASY